MQRKSILVMLCLGVVATAQSTLFAAPSGGGACLEDRQKLCADVKPGAGRIFKCLEKHQEQLSAECKNYVEEMARKFEQFADACADDLAKYCSQVKAGQGRGIACLRGNEDRISAACRDALPGQQDAE